MKIALIPFLSLLPIACTSVSATKEADTPLAVETEDSEPRIATPLSAQEAAQRVWEVVLARSGSTGVVALQSLKSSYRAGRQGGADRVDVDLDLVILGADTIEATATYVALMDALAAEPWCANVRRSPTRVLDDESGIEVRGLEIRVLLDPPAGESEPTEDPELAARRVAAVSNVGALDATVSTRDPAKSVRDHIYRFRPASRESSFELSRAISFLSALERETPSVTVTSLELLPSRKHKRGEPVPEWTFTVELTARSYLE